MMFAINKDEIMQQEDPEEEEIAADITAQVEIFYVRETEKCCVQFKRVSGDPFEYFEEIDRIRNDLQRLCGNPE